MGSSVARGNSIQTDSRLWGCVEAVGITISEAQKITTDYAKIFST
jgi:hypothetical protein